MTNLREKKRQFALFAASHSPAVSSTPPSILDHFEPDGDEPSAKRRATSPRLSIPTLRGLIIPRHKPAPKKDEVKQVKKEQEVRQQPSPSTETGTLDEQADSSVESDFEDPDISSHSSLPPSGSDSDSEEELPEHDESHDQSQDPKADTSLADETFHTTLTSPPSHA
ncbi:hypothetical protein BJ508DRAFT_363241, partial [Ascobolus immersus RN42]